MRKKLPSVTVSRCQVRIFHSVGRAPSQKVGMEKPSPATLATTFWLDFFGVDDRVRKEVVQHGLYAAEDSLPDRLVEDTRPLSTNDPWKAFKEQGWRFGRSVCGTVSNVMFGHLGAEGF